MSQGFGFLAAIVLVIIGLFYSALGMSAEEATVWTFGTVGVAFAIYLFVEYEKQQAKKDEENRNILEKNEKVEQFNLAGKESKWEFPAEKFYQRCSDTSITKISNEFELEKAKSIAEQLIKEACQEVDLGCFRQYLTRESLQKYMQQGKPQAEKTAQRKLEESKTIRNAFATAEEIKFIRRAGVLSDKTGRDKRIAMLNDLLEDCDQRIQQLRDGEEAMIKLAGIYSGMQKKEKNWAAIGGFAEGLAGPAAGIMAASDAMQDNYEIRKYNEEMRQTSIDIVKGTYMNNITDRYKLEKERNNIQQQIEATKTKVSLTNPTAQQIWKHFSAGNARVVRSESGVLMCSVTLWPKGPLHLDVPKGVNMVIDGTLKGDIWAEGKFVGPVVFPLPLYGIPCNTSSEVTVDGMCAKSMEYNCDYSLKLRAEPKLWIMEA